MSISIFNDAKAQVEGFLAILIGTVLVTSAFLIWMLQLTLLFVATETCAALLPGGRVNPLSVRACLKTHDC